MRELNIDIETYSSIDLKVSGVHRYAEAPDFAILLFGYSFDDDPVTVIDFTDNILDEDPRDFLPAEVLHALTDPTILKTAHNAAFELACISSYLRLSLDPAQWECTMVKVSMLGLPLSLDIAAKVLGLTELKDPAGKALINYFTKPCKPTKANGYRTRNLPEHAPEKWADFIEYGRQDVVVEKAIRRKVKFFTIPDYERRLWNLDQKINDYGVQLDRTLILNAIAMDKISTDELVQEAIDITGLQNPKSVKQLKTWLMEEIDEEVESLTKPAVKALLKTITSDKVKRVLTIRQLTSKSSIKKYTRMSTSIGDDERIRGIHQFYGANRTGRWAGRGIQPQNLTKNKMKDLDLARQFTREGDLDSVKFLWGNVSDTLSQLIRTAFVAPPGHRFIISDFSAIEARVIAWLAGEKWRLDIFNTHGKIYEASAAKMFNVPIEEVTKESEHRAKGKVAELALGYQGGPRALKKMDYDNVLVESELPDLVAAWRLANKRIVKLWYDMEDAAYRVVSGDFRASCRDITFTRKNGLLFLGLPSGRQLSYVGPRLKPGKFGNDVIGYMGLNQTTKQWQSQDTYGGKLVENAVQAIARDCLAEAMVRLDKAGYKIVMHVHDEVVMQVPNGVGSMMDVDEIMSQAMPWAPDLPLGAESTESLYYRKD